MTAARRGGARIAGAFEHPGRDLPTTSLAQLHAQVALGALEDAGLTLSDVDAYFCAGDAPGGRPFAMTDYLGLQVKYVDSTDTGGSSYLLHVAHAMEAIDAGLCEVALVTMGGRPRNAPNERSYRDVPQREYERLVGATAAVSQYALAAQRHMHEFGTTAEQLAEVAVSASTHGQHNPRAVRQGTVSVEEVLESSLVADPIHRLECCVVSDGGGAVVLVAPTVAKRLPRAEVAVLGAGQGIKHTNGGRIDLTYTAAAASGPMAFERAGVVPSDIDYASIYDSFTITVVQQLEDLGFCRKGQGGAFVASGALRAPDGSIPVNTDGGGLRNNHPANRGGMARMVEAVRQLRGEADEAVQVDDCRLALVQAMGGSIGSRMASGTLVLGRSD